MNASQDHRDAVSREKNNHTAWRLPPELILQIIENILEEPATFIFDIDIGPQPHPPLAPQGCRVRFRPIKSRKAESVTAETIRSLLSTNSFTRDACIKRLQCIPVPTVGRDCIVRFNPEHHIICINTIKRCPDNRRTVQPSGSEIEVWANDGADRWSELNFDIKHLSFIWGQLGLWQDVVAMFGFIFPGLEHLYSAVVGEPLRDPSKRLEVVLPNNSQSIPARFTPVFMYMAKRCWDLTRATVQHGPESLSLRPFFTDKMRNVAIKGLVLV